MVVKNIFILTALTLALQSSAVWAQSDAENIVNAFEDQHHFKAQSFLAKTYREHPSIKIRDLQRLKAEELEEPDAKQLAGTIVQQIFDFYFTEDDADLLARVYGISRAYNSILNLYQAPVDEKEAFNKEYHRVTEQVRAFLFPEAFALARDRDVGLLLEGMSALQHIQKTSTPSHGLILKRLGRDQKWERLLKDIQSLELGAIVETLQKQDEPMNRDVVIELLMGFRVLSQFITQNKGSLKKLQKALEKILSRESDCHALAELARHKPVSLELSAIKELEMFLAGVELYRDTLFEQAKQPSAVQMTVLKALYDILPLLKSPNSVSLGEVHSRLGKEELTDRIARYIFQELEKDPLGQWKFPLGQALGRALLLQAPSEMQEPLDRLLAPAVIRQYFKDMRDVES